MKPSINETAQGHTKLHQQLGLRLALHWETSFDSAQRNQFLTRLGWSDSIRRKAFKGQHDFRLTELQTIANYFKVSPMNVVKANF